MFFHSIESVLIIILLMGIGALFANKPWFGKRGSDFLSGLVLNICLPLYMVNNVITTFESKDKFLETLPGVLVPAIAISFLFVFAAFLSKILHFPSGRKGLFINVFSLANIVVVGFPVCETLFGPESINVCILFYIANTVIFWTLGNFMLARDGEAESAKKTPLFSLSTLKHIFSPPFLGFLVGVTLLLCNIKLPFVLSEVLAKVGASATPLCLFFVGSIMRNVDIKLLRPDKNMVLLILGRFLLAPAVMLLLLSFYDGPRLMKEVFFIMSTMPAMTQLSIICKRYGADYEYAAVITTVTTMLSLVLVPFYMYLTTVMPLFS